MVRSAIVVSLLAAASSAFAARPNIKGGKAATRVPGAFIYELDASEDASTFFDEINAEGTTRLELDYELFKGVSVQITDLKEADAKAAKIASLPAVKNMWPVMVYGIPKPEVHSVGTSGVTASLVQKRQENETADTFSPHIMTQVDKLRAAGYTGKGIKIAVIDSGVDWKHPALGGCFGEGCLVSFGHDLVGDDYNGYNTPVPDDDPMDCMGHGTHVSGIIAAQEEGNDFGFTGSAPGVTLGMFRTFGCDGEASNDVLIAAYNQAYESGADIITASIGGPSGWTEDPWAVAVSRIVEKGVPCTISAGNSGDAGLFFASTASNGLGITSVASFDNIITPSLLLESKFTIDGGEDEVFGYTPANPEAWTGETLPVWAPSYDTTEPAGGCDPYPADTPDLSGFIVLVRRGTCTFVQKAQNAAAFGAKYFIIYNNVAGVGQFDVSTVPGIIAAGMVTPETGAEWIAALKAGSEVLVTVSDPSDADYFLTEVANPITGGALSTYTSWGPTYEMDVKPQIGAPGGRILSTWPLDQGGYAVISGTSMACPLTAAAVALIAEVRGTFDPVLIDNLLASTANPQLFNDGADWYDFLAPVPQQGGGLIQVYDAAFTNSYISPSGLSFNDTDNLAVSRNFTLTNLGDEEVTYDISHIPTISMYTLYDGYIYPQGFPNDGIDANAELAFSETKITIAAGGSAVVEVLPTPPEGLAVERLAVWSGYVAVNGTDGSSLSIPYQGLAGSLNSATVLAPEEDTWVSRSDDTVNYVPVPENFTFTLPAPGSEISDDDVLPSFIAYLALGTPKLEAWLVPLTTCPPNSTTEVHGFKTIGQPEDAPYSYLPRTLNAFFWTGRTNTGAYAPEGKYKVVFRALHIYGDESDDSQWDVAETGSFRITYAS